MRVANGGSLQSRKSERGQSTAFVTSMLMVLMLFVGVVVDVGQAVNRRIALQIVADTGAYTGAAVMATGLNQMAYWNKRLQDSWALFTWAMFEAFTVRVIECSKADSAEGLYRGAHGLFAGALSGVNYVYGNYAYMEAKRVSLYNIDDLFPGEGSRFRFAEWSVSPEVGLIPKPRRDYPNLMNTREVRSGESPKGSVWGLIPAQKRLVYGCGSFPPPRLEIRYRTYDLWQQKADNDVKYFVWIVIAPKTKALLFDSLFGGDVIPEMKAAAVAKPVGGSIKDGKSEYITKIDVLSKVIDFRRYIVDSKYDRRLRTVTH